jgi:hypothetical protein
MVGSRSDTVVEHHDDTVILDVRQRAMAEDAGTDQLPVLTERGDRLELRARHHLGLGTLLGHAYPRPRHDDWIVRTQADKTPTPVPDREAALAVLEEHRRSYISR